MYHYSTEPLERLWLPVRCFGAIVKGRITGPNSCLAGDGLRHASLRSLIPVFSHKFHRNLADNASKQRSLSWSEARRL